MRKQLVLLIFIISIIVLTAYTGICGDSSKNTVYRTIKPGDTLSRIAKEAYGDPLKWKDIYNANKNSIGSNPNIIRAGQRIYIPNASPKLASPQEIYDKLIRHMFKVNNWKYIPRADIEHKLQEYKKFLVTSGTSSLYQQRAILSELSNYTRKYELYQLLDGIYEACKYDKSYTMTALLVAIAWQETHFKNVLGLNREITFYQLLPSTFKYMEKLDDQMLHKNMLDIINSPRCASITAYRWLMVGGMEEAQMHKAIRKWNNNVAYYNQVMQKYNIIRNIIIS